jgi:hypothetical protein
MLLEAHVRNSKKQANLEILQLKKIGLITTSKGPFE